MKKDKGSRFIEMYSDSLKRNLKYSKGFTLIELMVVISLMGLLSFIVLASMDSAREKGRDLEMQSLFASLRAKSEQYYSKYNIFGTNPEGYNLCSYDKTYGFGGIAGPGLLKDIADSASTSLLNAGSEAPGVWNQVTCHASDDAWAVEAPLSTSTDGNGGSRMLCVDSTTGIISTQYTNLKAYSYSCTGN